MTAEVLPANTRAAGTSVNPGPPQAPAGNPQWRRPLWLVAAGAGVVAGLAGSVLLYRHAVRMDLQPSPAPGAPDVLIPHYSTPWILAAAAAALTGLLLAVTLVGELARRRTDAALVPDLPVPGHPGTSAAPAPAASDPGHPLSVVPGGHPGPGSHPSDVWRPPAQARP